jgi:Uma2 family endonuclease
MAVVARTYTVEELWELSTAPEYADQRLELSEGELIVMSPTGLQHGWISNRLGRLLAEFVESKGLDIVTSAETGFILAPGTVRAPDFGYISFERLPEGLTERYGPFAPDLAVEVVSPNDRADEVHRKLLDYLRFGTRLVWLVYPGTRTIAVHDGKQASVLNEEALLEGGEVLPGFSLPVRRIFEGPPAR